MKCLKFYQNFEYHNTIKTFLVYGHTKGQNVWHRFLSGCGFRRPASNWTIFVILTTVYGQKWVIKMADVRRINQWCQRIQWTIS